MKKICFLNGKWLPEDRAKVSVFDAGFLYGYGVFETIRVADGKALFLAEHIKRLTKSLRMTGIKKIRYDFGVIVKAISKKNNLAEGVVRITITAGRFKDMPWSSNSGVPAVLVTVRGLKDTEDIYRKGVRVVFADEKEWGGSLAFPGIKSTSYIADILSKIYAKKKNAFEAIFVSPDGFLKEGATSNLFWVKNRIVYTPALTLGILPGITRNVVIKILKKMGLKVKEGWFRIKDFTHSEEAFLTNSTYGVVPIEGKGGKIVNDIRKQYGYYANLNSV